MILGRAINLVSEVSPAIYTFEQLLDFVHQQILDSLEIPEVEADKENPKIIDIFQFSDGLVPEVVGSITLSEVISQETYVWGELVQVNWGKLGYAPGGIQSYILPKNSRAADLDHLWLPWDKIQISHS